MSSALVVVAATTEHVNELPADPLVFGVGSFAILLALLLVTLSFNRER